MSSSSPSSSAPTGAGLLEKLSSTLQAAEEGVLHTAKGVAEGIQHGASQLLHGGQHEAEAFAHGVREANEAVPRAVAGGPKAGGRRTGVEHEMTGPASERLGAAGPQGQSALGEAKQSIAEKVQAAVDRGKELAGGVSREAGHAAGAAAAMDPDQPVPEAPRQNEATGFADALQHEYRAGQQEEMARPAGSADAPRSMAGAVAAGAERVRAETAGVVGGAARQYGKAAEAVRMKAEEGAKEAHK